MSTIFLRFIAFAMASVVANSSCLAAVNSNFLIKDLEDLPVIFSQNFVGKYTLQCGNDSAPPIEHVLDVNRDGSASLDKTTLLGPGHPGSLVLILGQGLRSRLDINHQAAILVNGDGSATHAQLSNIVCTVSSGPKHQKSVKLRDILEIFVTPWQGLYCRGRVMSFGSKKQVPMRLLRGGRVATGAFVRTPDMSGRGSFIFADTIAFAKNSDPGASAFIIGMPLGSGMEAIGAYSRKGGYNVDNYRLGTLQVNMDQRNVVISANHTLQSVTDNLNSVTDSDTYCARNVSDESDNMRDE